MATPVICSHFQFGFCKFREWCKFIHFENTRDIEKFKIESETIVKKLSNIDKELQKLKQQEEEIVSKKVFDEKISQLEKIIAKKKMTEFVTLFKK